MVVEVALHGHAFELVFDHRKGDNGAHKAVVGLFVHDADLLFPVAASLSLCSGGLLALKRIVGFL